MLEKGYVRPMGTAYQTDPLLRLIPQDSLPASYIEMSDEEQMWRGRWMLMTWVLHSSAAYAWAIALAESWSKAGPIMAGIRDADILDGLRAVEEVRVERAQAERTIS